MLKIKIIKFILANLVLSFAINTYSQLINDTIYFDSDWKQSIKENAKYYRIINNDTNGKFQFIVKDYYLSGQIQMKGVYKSIYPDYKIGKFTYWYENGQVQIICNYHNNDLNGKYIEYYENGQLKSERIYKNSVLEGIEKSWSNSGILNRIVEYKNGLKHGKFVTYYNNAVCYHTSLNTASSGTAPTEKKIKWSTKAVQK